MAPSPRNDDASPPSSDSPPSDNSSPPETSPSPPNNAPPGGDSLPPTSSGGVPPPAPPGVNPTPVPGTPLQPGTPNALPPKNPTKNVPARRQPSSRGSGSDSDISKEKIVAAAVGAGLFVFALVIICIICCCRKKKKQNYYDKPYYMDPNTKGNEQYYSSSQQHSNWQGSGQPPLPGVGWQGGQQHLPMMSSGHTSSNFSDPLHHAPILPPPSPGVVLAFNKSTFTYEELAAATGGFSHSNLLGQGGFGYVHKGTLPNGKVIAVKSLKMGSGQGEREFQAEVEIISRVHHRHLVSLVGYCIAGGQRMLVYDFVSNNNLEYHLHNKNLPPMDWPSRLRIALGSAKGLAYLHEDCHPRIIHRDIKAANILLDDNFEAMVADFGLAKLSSDNHTHVSTRIMGTFGYLAPEYASSGKLTEKSDVYSFGIMLLELITGRMPVDNSIQDSDSLVDWARPLLTRAVEEGKFDNLVDQRLGNNFDRREMTRMVSCAASSIRHSAKKRPKMSKIVHALEGDVSLDDLNEGTIPGHSNVFAKASDMDQHRKLALGSVEFSSEYGTGSSNDSR